MYIRRIIALCVVLHLSSTSILTIITRWSSSAGYSLSTYSYWHLAELRIVCVFEREKREQRRGSSGTQKREEKRQTKTEKIREGEGSNIKRGRLWENYLNPPSFQNLCLSCLCVKRYACTWIYLKVHFCLSFFFSFLFVTHISVHVCLYVSVERERDLRGCRTWDLSGCLITTITFKGFRSLSRVHNYHLLSKQSL